MLTSRSVAGLFVLLTGGWILAVSGSARAVSPPPRHPPLNSRLPLTTRQAVLQKYCVGCHNQRHRRPADWRSTSLDVEHPSANPDVWERVITKLRAGSMPPTGRPRPDAATYDALSTWLEGELDRAWAANPNPGRINAVHRINRTEYNNAIRDLFALDMDVKSLLPGDETADGSFDNFADVLTISTAHLERYLSVARQVTRLATGLPPAIPALSTYDIPLHIVQDDRQSDDLPFGSRGGIAVHYNFPVDGEYLIKVRLRRQYQDYLMGMGWPQQLDVRLDGKLLKRFIVGGGAKGRPAAASYAGDGEPGFAGDPEWEEYMQVGGDAGLEFRVPITAGPRVVGVSFVRELWEPEGLPQPQQRGACSRTISCTWTTPASDRCRLAARTTRSDRPEHVEPRAVFVCQPTARSRRACVRDEDSLAHRPARLSPAGHQRRCRDVAGVLRRRQARRRQLRRRHSVRARARPGRSRLPAARASRSGTAASGREKDQPRPIG